MTELAALILVALLGLVTLYFRLIPKRPWARPALAGVLALGLLLLLATDLASETTDLERPLAVIVDASFSMGPRLDDACDWERFARDPERRVLVVLAGSRPVLLHDGPAATMPGTWLNPAEYRDPVFRARSDLGLATTMLAGVLDAAACDLAVVSDGGMEAGGRSELRVAEAELVPGPRRRADDLGLFFLDPLPLLRDGVAGRLRVHLRGSIATARQLSVEIAGQGSMPLSLKAGTIDETLLFALKAPFPESEAFELRIVDGGPDADSSNDRLLVPFIVEGSKSLRLRIIGDSAATSSLRTWLATLDGVTLWPPAKPLAQADVILIDRCLIGSLPVSENELERLVLAGKVLVLSGPEQAFGAADWEGSKLDLLSPLKARPGAKPRYLRFALDRSGSMSRDDRLLAARASLRALFKTLAPGDRLELILFAGDRSRQIYAADDPSAAERLDQDLSRVRASGGTDLQTLLDELALRPAGTEDDEVMVILATDGRDPRGLDEERCVRIRERLAATEQSLQVFWFDRDPDLRPALQALAGDPRRLHEVDDFGRMLEPYFRALGDELEVEDVAVEDRDGRTMVLDRLLRTRRDPGAEILAAGEGQDRNAVATISRGLGRVVACPTDLMTGTRSGLFRATGDAAFVAFLAQQVPARSQAQVSRELDGDRERLRVEMPGEQLAGFSLETPEARTLSLEVEAPGRARTGWLLARGRSEDFRLRGPESEDRGLLRLPGLPALDLGPPPRPDELESRLEAGSGADETKRASPRLPLLLLVLLAIDLVLRSRGR